MGILSLKPYTFTLNYTVRNFFTASFWCYYITNKIKIQHPYEGKINIQRKKKYPQV